MQVTCHLRTYLTIRSRLIDFYYEPGAPLSPMKIAEELGVSMTPVREALMKLSAQGYVELCAGKGFSVHKPDAVFIRDRYEVLATLSGRALANLCQDRMENERNRVLSILSQRVEPLIGHPVDPESCCSFFEGAYDLIGRASGNSVLASALSITAHQTSFFRKVDFRTRLDLRDDIDETQAILESLRSRDYQRIDLTIRRMFDRRARSIPVVVDQVLIQLYKKFSNRRDRVTPVVETQLGEEGQLQSGWHVTIQ